MSYFPTDIPFMSEEELKANGIKVNCSEKSNSSNLRRCPFCGKEAEIEMAGHEVRYPREGARGFAVTYKVGCSDCCIRFAADSLFIPIEDGSIVTVKDGYKIAVDAWNRRGEK